MIKGGYILQPRKLDESEIMHEPPIVRELWLYLLRKVNFTDGKKLKRGQGFFNLNDIQNDLCWYSGYRKNTYSKPQLTKSLRKLREGNMIETTKETRGIIVTVCNYEYYQNPKNYEGNDEGNAKETRRQRQSVTITKEGKERKEERNGYTHPICLAIEKELPNVAKMKKPLTDQEAQKLLENYTNHGIWKILRAMDNWKPLNKNNVSTYDTAINWLNRDGCYKKRTREEIKEQKLREGMR